MVKEMKTKHLQHIILILFFLASPFSQAKSTEDLLLDELAAAKTTDDSLKTLLNIYDIKPYNDRAETLERIYALADSAKNEKYLIDVLSLMAACYEANDSMQAILIKRAQSLPQSDALKSTTLYIKLRNAFYSIRTMSDEERQQKLLEHLAYYKEAGKLDNYKKIEYLFYLCTYLQNTAEGDLLIKYLRELRDEIDKLPARDILLRSLFYNQASKSFLSSGLLEEAAQANKKVLEIVKELDRIHAAEGRIYRDYSGSIYLAYHNLLLCHKVLSDKDIDAYYKRMVELEHSSKRLQDNVNLRRRSKIYYLIAKRKYEEAIPLIKTQLQEDNNNEEYYQLITALIEASRATGDKEDLLNALTAYTDLLQKRIETKANASYKELQILYEVDKLKQENNDLIAQNQIANAKRHKAFVTYTIIFFIIVILLLGIVFELYRKAKHLAKGLSNSNKLLIAERDALKDTQKDLIKARDKAKAADRIKTDFVNNMSHEIRTPLSAIAEYSSLVSDCAEEDKREYIRRFADIISLNTDLLLNLVNDVLELPALENAKMNVCISPSSIQEICNMSIDSVRKRIQPGVELVFANQNDNDTLILTDHHRVEQVLLNMLSNAAKFTEDGKITLEYKFSDDRSKVTFSVTDTGIGIPRDKEEVIFSRFEKLNSDTQGNGLGLYISRLLADLLKGEIKVDADYRKGARFIFTIPVV